MTKILIGMLSLALVGVGGLVAAVDGFGDDQSVRSVSIPAGTTTAGTTTSAEDVSGPCDEPEHATDPRCTGDETAADGRGGDDQEPVVVPAVTTAGTTTDADDVSGPCDEPEHATDPRCTGAGTTTDGGKDRSGSGHDDNDNDDDDDEDRSGSNSGKS